MIKINLLPHAKRAKVSDAERQVLLFFLLTAFVTSAIIASGIWSGGKVRELEEVVQEKEIQRQVLMSRVGRMNQLQQEYEEIESNITAIREIRLKQQLPIRYVDETVRFLPSDMIWFESLSLSGEGVLDIRGVAMDNQAFAGYVDNLRTSPYIRTVSTQRTLRRQVRNLDLVEFQFQIRAGPVIFRREDKVHENKPAGNCFSH